jgi:inner membrane protein
MRGYTHLSTALFFALIYLVFIKPQPHVYQTLLFLAITIFGALIPDIDAARSKMGKRFKLIAFFFEHRGFWHSGILGIFLGIAFHLIAPRYTVAILIGYFSHLLLDSTTKAGVALFWPSKIKFRGPFVSGKLTDKIIFLITIVADVYLFLLL